MTIFLIWNESNIDFCISISKKGNIENSDMFKYPDNLSDRFVNLILGFIPISAARFSISFL